MSADARLARRLAGALAGTAVAITCVPCARSGGHFVPTSDLVLADLTGRQDPHPVYDLARRLTGRPAVVPRDGRVVVLFDDLDVARNWMLPPDPPRVETVWPAVRAAAHGVLSPAVEVELLSEWLRAHRALEDYEDAVRECAQRFLRSLTNPAGAGAARRLMTGQLARRRRFAPDGGGGPVVDPQMRERAARHLANYAVQGRMVVAASAASYLLGGDEEAAKMGVFEPGFAAVAVRPPEPPPAGSGSPAELVAAVIPERHADLRGSLPLYLADLPATPGAVVPGLVADIVAAVGKVLTPGTSRAGVAEISALNSVLGGGPANRERAEAILARLLEHLRAPHTAGPGADPAGEAARKLFGHLAVRWDDDALTVQFRRHRETLDRLAAAVDAGDQVALAVTGSLTAAPGGWWHPYLSDIDVMPLRDREPSSIQVEELRRVYDGTRRPPWVYLNAGACCGVAGVDRDPRRRLFVAEHLPSLAAAERRLLGSLLAPARFLAGDRRIFAEFRAGFDALPAPGKAEP